MKLAITGALGHIGSRLIHSLAPGEFDEVLLIDDLSTQRFVSLFNLPKGVRFRFVKADVLSADLEKLLAGAGAVIHLAAITNAAESFDIQQQVERVNFDGTLRVADACAKTGARLIFLSTTSVYGTASTVVDEDCPESDLKPQSPYATSKLRAEKHLVELRQATGLRHVACRFGTIYGTSPGMRFHTAVNKFCWQACLGEPITVWRTALNQKRPYLELGDAVRALRFIIEHDLFDGELFNVLTDNVTVGEIVDTIRKFVPDLAVELVDSKIMNQLSYDVSAERFKKRGFVAQGDLEAGIGATVELLRGVRSAGS